jgi:hypothetical protein
MSLETSAVLLEKARVTELPVSGQSRWLIWKYPYGSKPDGELSAD